MSPFVKCQSKLAFATKDEARAYVSAVKKRPGYRPGRLQAYRCDCCGMWHFGRRR